MVDGYTKLVLTVIAAMMVYNAVKDEPSSASAAPADCGDRLAPCYVTLDRETLKVTVEGIVQTWQAP
ncbi:hypothetical protein [Sinorhizobium meliloti]|uniref:hypothetical protein n=1 Tax=Rhizobium meliloti TaxID=382 RepID=UPI00299CF2CE|nr:hypothetical protein [Sinorhizobium meliloti]MDW9867228.1 hypothetical protein [Sinorhizobium meliloti]